MQDFLFLMKNELVITFIIFLLLFIKIGKGMNNERILPLIQGLLFLNVVAGFLFYKRRELVQWYVPNRCTDRLSKKYSKHREFYYFISMRRLVEEVATPARIFYASSFFIAWHVLYDLQRKFIDVLFIT